MQVQQFLCRRTRVTCTSRIVLKQNHHSVQSSGFILKKSYPSIYVHLVNLPFILPFFYSLYVYIDALALSLSEAATDEARGAAIGGDIAELEAFCIKIYIDPDVGIDEVREVDQQCLAATEGFPTAVAPPPSMHMPSMLMPVPARP